MAKILLVFSLFLTFNSVPSLADDASARIAKAVKIFSPLALSGVEKLKVSKAGTVKEMLLDLALQKGHAESEEDFNWVGDSGDAWEPDSTNWGQTDMKGAFSYITEPNEDYLESLTPAERRKVDKQIAAAKDAFKLLLNSGVKFGIAPLGAVQCGVTFAALAIIDPRTKTIWIFAAEGSGC